jgi:hypothetical protein
MLIIERLQLSIRHYLCFNKFCRGHRVENKFFLIYY